MMKEMNCEEFIEKLLLINEQNSNEYLDSLLKYNPENELLDTKEYDLIYSIQKNLVNGEYNNAKNLLFKYEEEKENEKQMVNKFKSVCKLKETFDNFARTREFN